MLHHDLPYYVESRPSPSTVLSRSSRPKSGNCGVARAKVMPSTCAAPACFKARAQAESVAPVVMTSSTSTTRRPANLFRLHHLKSPTQILAPRRHAQSRLRRGGALAAQTCRSNPGRRPAALPLQRPRQARRQQFRLIKSALTPARRVQWYRNDEVWYALAQLRQRTPKWAPAIPPGARPTVRPLGTSSAGRPGRSFPA